ncbi:MAG: zinc ribbon domain-containing protein [Anaerolineaceae bacterium]|nr:MAG: zinc ribbon domain-containing protein [Anaerolineaceae bacterium]
MPSYDYKCQDCGARFALFYKTYADYDAADKSCPQCDGKNIARVIKRINVQKPGRDYGSMSSGEMLSVLESGDSRQVGEMFEQVGGANPALGKQYHDATQKLLRGESKDSVEQSLKAASDGKKTKT